MIPMRCRTCGEWHSSAGYAVACEEDHKRRAEMEAARNQALPNPTPRYPRKPITRFQARFAALKMIFSEALKRVMRGF